MSCDFKPGDEVVCVDTNPSKEGRDVCHTFLSLDEVYTVEAFDGFTFTGVPRVFLIGVDPDDHPSTRASFAVRRFRKVQRRNSGLTIESFLTIKSGQPEGPTRTPSKEKAKEKAQ